MQTENRVLSKEALIQKTLKLLEFDSILERLARHSMSEEATAIIKNEKPYGDAETVTKTKDSVRAVISRIQGGGGDPRKYLPSIGFLFPKLEVEGTSLELDEAHAIGLFAERGEELRNWLLPHPVFEQMLAEMPNCADIATSVFRVIDKDGNIRDLPELRAIKQRIRNLKAGLETAVSRYTTSEDAKRMLQSAIPSQRDGRIVLAVKANFRGKIRGIVHEVSSSGQTIFVEPEEVVEKNNEIIIETRNLSAEIRKILNNLTGTITSRRIDLKTFHVTILTLEVLMAKARYSLETSGHFSGDTLPPGRIQTSINLVQARHPLLVNAVPINLTMAKTKNDVQTDSGLRALIITGPNTGGKTVSLKTVGLFAMMNQIGLAIPAEEGSTMPVFDCIFADIGDEQSIGQSLSTFSAHITNIAGIIAHSTANSLALLDELGSGTDPQEGGAIAMAILDHLIEKKSTLIITTHHGILKNYGYTRQDVENASVEFDSGTLSPTYRIITGVPGESRALEIAERNGLSANIATKARSYIDSGHSDVSALISGLKEKHRELDTLTEKARLEENHLRDERRKSDLKELRLRQKELELKAGYAGRLRLLLDESRKTLENLIRELREGEISREKTIKVKEFLRELARTVEAEDATLEAEKKAITKERNQDSPPPGRGGMNNPTVIFAPGLEVFVGESKRRGVLVRIDKKNRNGNTWIVEVGSLKMSFAQTDLVPANPSPPPKPQIARVDFADAPSASLEINLRGMRMDEALDTLRRQLDAAVLCGLKTFYVVHGKGDGILQKGVHEQLKKEPAVADYFFSHPELGGFGRTEVVLR